MSSSYTLMIITFATLIRVPLALSAINAFSPPGQGFLLESIQGRSFFSAGTASVETAGEIAERQSSGCEISGQGEFP